MSSLSLLRPEWRLTRSSQIFVSSFLLHFFDGGRVVDMDIASAGKAPSKFTEGRRQGSFIVNNERAVRTLKPRPSSEQTML